MAKNTKKSRKINSFIGQKYTFKWKSADIGAKLSNLLIDIDATRAAIGDKIDIISV